MRYFKKVCKRFGQFKKKQYLCTLFHIQAATMINRSVDMIFEPSGMPVPSEEDVRFEAREIVQRSGWGMPLIEALRKMADPYWCEAVARCLLDKWRDMVRDKDEQTYFYDMDGDIRVCWADAEYDFHRIIRRCTDEQVAKEQQRTELQPVYCMTAPPAAVTQVNKFYQITIEQNNAPIISDSNVTIHSK